MLIDDKALARFWDKVLKDNNSECWLWLASTDTSGYGIFRVNGRLQKAHRFSYQIHFGRISSLCVLHKCDEPLCVNPNHLFLGTAKENSEDRDKKNRGCLPYQIGKRYQALTAEQAQEVRRLYSTGNYSQRQLAKEFGVSQAPIFNVIHLEGGY